MNQKGFIKDLVIVILGVLVLGGGYFVFFKKTANAPAETSSQTETANWKTYRNDNMGFTIKYPIEAKEVRNKKVFGENILFALNLTPTQTKWNNLGLNIATVNIPNCYYSPLGQSVKNETSTVNGSSFCLNIEEDSGTGGEASRDYYYTTKRGAESLLLSFHIEYNKYCGLNYPEFAKCEKFNPTEDTKIFNQILSTFKFIK